MTKSLFRTEALQSKRHAWLGSISLAQSTPTWVLTLIATLATVGIGLFLVLGTYTRRTTVMGQLVPKLGLSTVLAQSTGVISRLEVSEGDIVSKGQRLGVVTVPRSTVTEGDTLAALSQQLDLRRSGILQKQEAQIALLAVQGAGYREQLAASRRELRNIEAEIGNRRQQIQIAEGTLQRLRRLEEGSYVSLLQIEQQKSKALSWLGELQALERQAIAVRRSMSQQMQSLHELPQQVKATNAAAASDLAQLEQEQVEAQARGALTINAPVDGTVSAQLVKPGQVVQSGQPLLSLLPAGDVLEAELFVPSRAIGFIERGDNVRLRYQAYPYQKFGHQQGKVSRISRSAIVMDDLGPRIGHLGGSEPIYRVTVVLERQVVTAFGNEEPLRPGMLVDAEILGERRKLIEWLLEPLHSLSGKVGTG